MLQGVAHFLLRRQGNAHGVRNFWSTITQNAQVLERTLWALLQFKPELVIFSKQDKKFTNVLYLLHILMTISITSVLKLMQAGQQPRSLSLIL